MSERGVSLADVVSRQLACLGAVAGLAGERAAQSVLRELVGPAGGRQLTEPALWPSDIADDHTPVEFSLALAAGAAPSLRVMGETLAAVPGPAANRRAAQDLLARWVSVYGLSTGRLEQVSDLFLPEAPAGLFGMWFSLVFGPAGRPAFKVYLDPAARGAQRAPELVAEGLARLGLASGYRRLRASMGERDRFSFFALDLHEAPGSRVKVYVAHDHATTDDLVRAVGAAAGVDAAGVVEFCVQAGGGRGPFEARPLLSGYTWADGDTDRPSGYSLYLPIRSYVRDDAQARQRVAGLLAGHGLDSGILDAALAAVTGRRLDEGVGLIAHVSLRLGRTTPGITVYLSSEAYATAPPHETARPDEAMSSHQTAAPGAAGQPPEAGQPDRSAGTAA